MLKALVALLFDVGRRKKNLVILHSIFSNMPQVFIRKKRFGITTVIEQDDTSLEVYK